LEELEGLYEVSKTTSDIIGLTTTAKHEEDKRNVLPDRDSGGSSSSPSFESRQSPAKKLKRELALTPEKSSPKRKMSGNLDGSQGQKTKNVSDGITKAKKPKLEKDDNGDSKAPSKQVLPNIFSGVKLYIPPPLKNYEALRRYFIAYDGFLLENNELTDATHVISTSETKGTKLLKNCKKITVDWLWDSIKLQKFLSEDLYKPESD